eukprot:683412-Pleurochrysis_carterae.AAC.1
MSPSPPAFFGPPPMTALAISCCQHARLSTSTISRRCESTRLGRDRLHAHSGSSVRPGALMPECSQRVAERTCVCLR